MEEDRKDEECNLEIETLEHMLKGCGGEGKSEWKRETLLQESDDGLAKMKRLISRRGYRRDFREVYV